LSNNIVVASRNEIRIEGDLIEPHSVAILEELERNEKLSRPVLELEIRRKVKLLWFSYFLQRFHLQPERETVVKPVPSLSSSSSNDGAKKADKKANNIQRNILGQLSTQQYVKKHVNALISEKEELLAQEKKQLAAEKARIVVLTQRIAEAKAKRESANMKEKVPIR